MRGVGDRIELDDSIVTAVLRALRAEHPDQRRSANGRQAAVLPGLAKLHLSTQATS